MGRSTGSSRCTEEKSGAPIKHGVRTIHSSPSTEAVLLVALKRLHNLRATSTCITIQPTCDPIVHFLRLGNVRRSRFMVLCGCPVEMNTSHIKL
jgi:hypothetical protein